MESGKRGSRWAALVGLVLTGLVVVLGNAHLCHLHSTYLEVAMVVLPLAAWFWAAKAATPLRAWLRVGIALVVAVCLQKAYLDWLHSPAFPRALLSETAKQPQAEIEARRGQAARHVVQAPAVKDEAAP